jgi:colanic acid biosynthesis glycosyl transferase WcaI
LKEGLSGSKYRIVPFSKEHIEGAVEMHILAFRDFFLTSLGRGFLREFYAAMTGQSNTVGYVALNSHNRVIGACIGLVSAKNFYRNLVKKKWFTFAFQALKATIINPKIIPRLLRALKHESSPPPCSIENLGALQTTSVEPCAQGLGVVIALMRSVCDEYVRRGVDAVYLNTDADNNDRVRGFYSAMGWEFLNYYTTPEGRRMCWYLWQNPDRKVPICDLKHETLQ